MKLAIFAVRRIHWSNRPLLWRTTYPKGRVKRGPCTVSRALLLFEPGSGEVKVVAGVYEEVLHSWIEDSYGAIVI